MIVRSEIIDDEIRSNALYKVETKYSQIYDPIYPDFLSRMKNKMRCVIRY